MVELRGSRRSASRRGVSTCAMRELLVRRVGLREVGRVRSAGAAGAAVPVLWTSVIVKMSYAPVSSKMTTRMPSLKPHSGVATSGSRAAASTLISEEGCGIASRDVGLRGRVRHVRDRDAVGEEAQARGRRDRHPCGAAGSAGSSWPELAGDRPGVRAGAGHDAGPSRCMSAAMRMRCCMSATSGCVLEVLCGGSTSEKTRPDDDEHDRHRDQQLDEREAAVAGRPGGVRVIAPSSS